MCRGALREALVSPIPRSPVWICKVRLPNPLQGCYKKSVSSPNVLLAQTLENSTWQLMNSPHLNFCGLHDQTRAPLWCKGLPAWSSNLRQISRELKNPTWFTCNRVIQKLRHWREIEERKCDIFEETNLGRRGGGKTEVVFSLKEGVWCHWGSSQSKYLMDIQHFSLQNSPEKSQRTGIDFNSQNQVVPVSTKIFKQENPLASVANASNQTFCGGFFLKNAKSVF